MASSQNEIWTATGAIAGIAGVVATLAIALLAPDKRDSPAPVAFKGSVEEPFSHPPSGNMTRENLAIADSAEAGRLPLRKGQGPNAALRSPTDKIIVADGGLPDVAAAADEAIALLRSASHSVRGNLRSTQSQPDHELHGLITTNLILDVQLVRADGSVREAFTVTTRGIGFTSETSALQARQRLRAEIRARGTGE